MGDREAHFHFIESNEAKRILSEKMYWDSIAKEGFEVFTNSEYSGFYAVDLDHNGVIEIKDDLKNDIFFAPTGYGSPLDIAEKIGSIEWNHYGYLWFDSAEEIKDQIFGKASDPNATAAMAVGMAGILLGGMAFPLYVAMAVSVVGGSASLAAGDAHRHFSPISEYTPVVLYDE